MLGKDCPCRLAIRYTLAQISHERDFMQKWSSNLPLCRKFNSRQEGYFEHVSTTQVYQIPFNLTLDLVLIKNEAKCFFCCFVFWWNWAKTTFALVKKVRVSPIYSRLCWNESEVGQDLMLSTFPTSIKVFCSMPIGSRRQGGKETNLLLTYVLNY